MATITTCDWCGNPVPDHDKLTLLPYSDQPADWRYRDLHHDCATHLQNAVSAALKPSEAKPAKTYRRAWVEAYTPRERELMILNLLGDEHLTPRDLAERATQHIREAHPATWHVNASDIQAYLYRLMKQGDIDRQPIPHGGTRTKWAYHRRDTLTGPIADLDKLIETDHHE